LSWKCSFLERVKVDISAVVFEALEPICNVYTYNLPYRIVGEIDVRCGKGTNFEEMGTEILMLENLFEVMVRDEMRANVVDSLSA
jgi:hypothetical protein